MIEFETLIIITAITLDVICLAAYDRLSRRREHRMLAIERRLILSDKNWYGRFEQ